MAQEPNRLCLAVMLLLCAMALVCRADDIDCSKFDPNVDNFPDKVDPKDLPPNLAVTYHNSYKLLTTPAGESLCMYLCTQPSPALENAKLIRIPSHNIFVQSPDAIAFLENAGGRDSIKFIGSTVNVSSPCLSAKQKQGAITGNPTAGTYEVEFMPDVSKGSNVFVQFDSTTGQQEPLLTAETWLLYAAMFLNLEKSAAQTVSEMRLQYQCRQNQVKSLPQSPAPKVAWIRHDTSTAQGDTWQLNNNVYAQSIIQDAGGIALPSGNFSKPTDLLAAISSADVVIDESHRPGGNIEYDDWLQQFGIPNAQDTKYTFVTQTSVWLTDARRSLTGIDDYPNSHTAFPNFMLQDVMAAVYPTLQKGYAPRYLRNLAHMDQPSQSGGCSVDASMEFPSNNGQCTTATALNGVSDNNQVDTGVDNIPGPAPVSPGGSRIGAIVGAVVGVAAVAGLVVFGWPKVARQLRTRKNIRRFTQFSQANAI
ncbi:ubiquitin-conjugating enzyme E2 K [Sorochytrium milnesiophthora]